MSTLEESLKILAESNLALAKAQTYYADTINKYGLKIEKANTEGGAAADTTPPATTTKAPTAAEKKAAKLAADAAAAKKVDNDGFGDAGEAAEEALDKDQVKEKLIEMMKANGGDKTPALAILKSYGYAGIPEIQSKDYRAIYNDAQAWIDDNVE